MNVILLTATTDPKVKAGVETYNEYLKKVFPGMKIISYETVKPGALEWFSPLKEPMKAGAVCSFLKENIGTLKPDLVITNGMFGWNLKERDAGCPIINISHGTFAGLADNAIKPGPEFCRTRFIYAFFEKMSAGNASLVVSNSGLTKELNKKYYGIGSEVILNPVDTKTFKARDMKKAREKLGLDPEKTIGLFVGRPEYQKGFDLLEKIAGLRPEIGFISITFPKTKSTVKNITGVSVSEREELALYYAAADFVVFPSRFEGFGFVPIEALSCNTPVISGNVGVVREIRADGLEKVSSMEAGEWCGAIDRVLGKKSRPSTAALVAEKFGFGKFRRKFLALAGRITKN